MTKRTSRKRTSRNGRPGAHSRLLAMQKARAPFIVDMPPHRGAPRKSLDYYTQTEALRAAKAAGTSDLPAVVWRHKAHGTYRPFRVVVEGRVFR